ncbi:MAG: hypothetical protein PHQ67_05130 [Fermentimonas sp.]|nr:hypothetical protein [Fermentimonas sp.]
MSGRLKIPCLTGVLLIGLFTNDGLKAQASMQDSIQMEIREFNVNEQVLSHVLKFTNSSKNEFKGTVKFNSISEINTLSSNRRPIDIAPGDSSFVAFKFLIGKNISAGTKILSYGLFDESDIFVLNTEVKIEVKERVHIHLMTDDAPVMLINPEDSVRINVTVNNFGNTFEEVTLIFNVPELRGASPFTEMKATVDPMSRKIFTYSFIPSNNLLTVVQFPVQITAVKGSEKMIFGNRSVIVQNVSTKRSYGEVNPGQTMFAGLRSYDNSVTLSYSQYNSLSSILQLQGGGYLNLPAGYLHLKSNLYKYSAMRAPVVTNTSLNYKLHENEFTIGNLNEQMELPLFGRGAKIKLSNNKKSKIITLGAIDQNFNLLSSRPWFAGYFSFYAMGEIGSGNYDRGAKASYLYQKNPYERADYHLGSLQWRNILGNSWDFDLKAHVSMGRYDKGDSNKFSGAAELSYGGNIFENVKLNGSGYYSDGYFPGSRRGTTNLLQEVNIKLSSDIHLSGSFGYNKTKPKYYRNNYEFLSENSNVNLFLSLPKISRLFFSVFYRHQGERSSFYAKGNQHMASHRIGWQWRWQNPGMKHSLFGTIETGFFNDPLERDQLVQAKTTLNYSYQWMNVDLSYQTGAYYLYEYTMAKLHGAGFYRFIASVSVRKDISKKILLSSAVHFTRNAYQGNIPSVTLNINWSPKDNISLFLNSYWYRYPFINQKNIFNTEVGVSYIFSKTKPLSGRKSNVIAQVYYDHNSNDRFDEGDEPASDYLINIDENAFVSDKKGKVRYSSVPYGDYEVKPMYAGRWFFNKANFRVHRSETKLNIPLKRSGTLRGNIRYVMGDYSMDITPRYEGLRFTVYNSDSCFTRAVVTDSEGEFMTFLPQGMYTIILDKRSLMEHTDCKESVRVVRIVAGMINYLEDFEIEVKERKINVKRFYN